MSNNHLPEVFNRLCKPYYSVHSRLDLMVADYVFRLNRNLGDLEDYIDQRGGIFREQVFKELSRLNSNYVERQKENSNDD